MSRHAAPVRCDPPAAMRLVPRLGPAAVRVSRADHGLGSGRTASGAARRGAGGDLRGAAAPAPRRRPDPRPNDIAPTTGPAARPCDGRMARGHDRAHPRGGRHRHQSPPARGQAANEYYEVAARRLGAGGAGAERCLGARRHPARRHDAGHGRLRGLPAAEGRARAPRISRRHGHRADRPGRARARPRGRRRRLPLEAGGRRDRCSPGCARCCG